MVEGFELEAWNRSPLSNLDVVTLVLPYRDALVNEIGEIEQYLFCLFPIFVHLLFETLDLAWNRLGLFQDRKSTRLNSSHRCISYAVFCLKKKTERQPRTSSTTTA